jgi:histidinol-phosphate aminotransferase
MICLDRNENLFGPAPECISVLRSATLSDLSVYSREYLRKVKSVLSEKLASQFGIPESQLLIAYGCEDMLKQIVHCYIGTGDILLVPHLSWWYYKSIAGEVGGVVKEYPLHDDGSRFVYQTEEIVNMVKAHRPRILLIASPNNPTGNAMPVDQLRQILDRCSDTLVVLDEAYFGFSNEDQTIVPHMTVSFPNLAVLRTFSKLYGLAGLRIGYGCAGAAFRKLTTYSMRYLGYNTLSEKMALTALSNEGYYTSLGLTIAEERLRYQELFSHIPGAVMYHSDANFILVKFGRGDAARTDTALRSAGIAVKFFTEKELECCARITIGIPEQNKLVRRCIEKLFMSKNQEMSTII